MLEQGAFFRSPVLTNYQAFDLAISVALCLSTAIYVAFWQAQCEHCDFLQVPSLNQLPRLRPRRLGREWLGTALFVAF